MSDCIFTNCVVSGSAEWGTLRREPDPVNHPAHYTQFPVEVIDITEHLSFNLGNVVKYACRAGRKDGADPIEDLRKAEFYLKREIERLSKDA